MVQLSGAPPRLRDRVWVAFVWTLSPVLVFARVYDVRPALMSRIVVGTTLPAAAAVVLVVGLAR